MLVFTTVMWLLPRRHVLIDFNEGLTDISRDREEKPNLDLDF